MLMTLQINNNQEKQSTGQGILSARRLSQKDAIKPVTKFEIQNFLERSVFEIPAKDTRSWEDDLRDAQRFNCQNCASSRFVVADVPPETCRLDSDSWIRFSIEPIRVFSFF